MFFREFFIVPIIFLILSLLKILSSTQYDDLIQYLPGLKVQPTFKQYSGFLQGSSPNIQLHYWFVEAVENPSIAPVVLWLNGGPGCSSLLGILTENGPFNVVANKSLDVNPFSWNKFANILYLESPAGVGYSYAVDGNVTTSDDTVSENNYYALLDFFNRFPSFANNRFYIFGESYGGVYVPTLAIRIVNSSKLRLDGIAIGNGYVHQVMNDNSLIYFAYYHGLLGERLWNQLLSSCCNTTDLEVCYFTMNNSIECTAAILEVIGITESGLDPYNLYAPCAGGVKVDSRGTELNNYSVQKPPLNRHQADMSNLFRNYKRHGPISTLVISCSDDSSITEYLNDHEVRKALHIPEKIPEWNSCSTEVNSLYIRKYTDLSKQYLMLYSYGLNIWFYNGDVDMACNFLGDEWFTNDLNIPLSVPRHEWYYIAADGTTQVGGFTKTFSLYNGYYNLTYLTVRGSGHMVPTDKPAQALTIFSHYIESISP